MNFLDDGERLFLQLDQLSAALSKSSIVVGHLFDVVEMLLVGGDGLGLLLPSIRKDGGGVELSFRASTVFLSTLSIELIEGARQHRGASVEGVHQLLEQLLVFEELCAEVAEFSLGHVLPGGCCWRALSECNYVDWHIDFKSENLHEAKKTKKVKNACERNGRNATGDGDAP